MAIDPTVPNLILQAGQIQAQQAGVPLSILADALTGMEKTFKEMDRRQEKLDDATMKLLDMKSRFPQLDVNIDPTTNRPTVRFRSPQELAQEALSAQSILRSGEPPIPEGLIPTRATRDGIVFEAPPTPVPPFQIPEGFEVTRIGPQGPVLEPRVDLPPLTEEDITAFGATPEQSRAIMKMPPQQQRQMLNTLVQERGRTERATAQREILDRVRTESNDIRKEFLDLAKEKDQVKKLERISKLQRQISALEGNPIFRFTPGFMQDALFFDTLQQVQALKNELQTLESGQPAPARPDETTPEDVRKALEKAKGR